MGSLKKCQPIRSKPYVSYWLIDWLIEWLIELVIDWLVDWLIASGCSGTSCSEVSGEGWLSDETWEANQSSSWWRRSDRPHLHILRDYGEKYQNYAGPNHFKGRVRGKWNADWIRYQSLLILLKLTAIDISLKHPFMFR